MGCCIIIPTNPHYSHSNTHVQFVSEQNIIIHKDLNEPSAHFPSLISTGDKNVWSDSVITTLIYSHNLTCVLKPTVVSGVLFNWTVSLVLASLVSSALFCFCHVCWPSHSEWVAAHTNVERILAEPLQRSHSRRVFYWGFFRVGGWGSWVFASLSLSHWGAEKRASTHLTPIQREAVMYIQMSL